MTHRAEDSIATPVEGEADVPPRAPSGGSYVDPAASFLAGELLSRAEARAGEGRLTPSDLGAGGAPTAWKRSWIFFDCISNSCAVSIGCQTHGFFRTSCEPEGDPQKPSTPEQPERPRPRKPGEPDAVGR
jgi:hypothetical protein